MNLDPDPVAELAVAIDEAREAARYLYHATLHRVFNDGDLHVRAKHVHRSAHVMLLLTDNLLDAAPWRGIDL